MSTRKDESVVRRVENVSMFLGTGHFLSHLPSHQQPRLLDQAIASSLGKSVVPVLNARRKYRD